mmetsp:Transcript_20062/g.76910  ORF Transcript_20062/g.76910 Transcript_20062/m.76910 type:complete len:230 (-) Transcript_20062:210-899(-)
MPATASPQPPSSSSPQYSPANTPAALRDALSPADPPPAGPLSPKPPRPLPPPLPPPQTLCAATATAESPVGRAGGAATPAHRPDPLERSVPAEPWGEYRPPWPATGPATSPSPPRRRPINAGTMSISTAAADAAVLTSDPGTDSASEPAPPRLLSVTPDERLAKRCEPAACGLEAVSWAGDSRGEAACRTGCDSDPGPPARLLTERLAPPASPQAEPSSTAWSPQPPPA